MSAPGQPHTVVRSATPEDIPSIARIWNAGWRDAHLGRVPRELVEHRAPSTYPARVEARLESIWVGVRDEVVEGFVVSIHDEIEQLYVDASVRGTGLGKLLVTRGEAAITERGHGNAWLAVVAGNRTARTFYERAGWHDAGPIEYDAESGDSTVLVPCRRYAKAVAR